MFTDLTFCDDYFEEMGETRWTGTTALKTAALNRAWRYVKTLNWTEGLPEIEAGETEFADELQEAQAEAALIELITPNELNATIDNSQRIQSISVDGVVSIDYADSTSAEAQKQYTTINRLLRGYLTSFSSIRVIL